MTAAPLVDIHEPSPGFATQPAIPLCVPRVAPLDGPVGNLSFFATLLRNPLRILPASVYEEGIVLAGRAGRAVCWITDPSLIKTVLLDKHDIFCRTPITQRILGPLLGKGVLTADGADWKWQRQTAAPVFRHHDLLGFVPTIAEAAERLLVQWREGASGAVRDVDRDMTLVTFDVISHTLLPGGDEHVGPLIGRANIDYQKPLGWQMAYANFGLPSWMPHPGKLKMYFAQRWLRSAVAALVAERRASPIVKDDLLQRLANAKNPETGAQMPDELLIDNLLTFFLAGHETTAKALTWTLYRQATVDTELADVPISAGTQIIIPIYAIQRHRRWWSNPDRFEPTRFAPENEAEIPRYHYMPFGAGPRICIGMAFSLIEGVAILATLVRAATFATTSEHEPEAVSRVTLRPEGGMPLLVQMR
jgi:cytochrome P450